VLSQEGENCVFRGHKLLPLAIILFGALVLNASPTAKINGDIWAVSSFPANSKTSIPCILDKFNVTTNTRLADLSREILKPPTAAGFVKSPIAHRAKSLPVIHGAVLMVLFGFLCISLVRDRRVWLVALSSLIWAGHAGVHAVPRVALHLNHKNHSRQQLCAEHSYPYYLENSNRLRCDVEGTQYIGLLHYLAGVPDASSAFKNTPLTLSHRHQKPSSAVLSYFHKNTYPYLSAIIPEQCSLNSLFKCLASKAEQFICFSPAFIFELIPRGPPLLA